MRGVTVVPEFARVPAPAKDGRLQIGPTAEGGETMTLRDRCRRRVFARAVDVDGVLTANAWRHQLRRRRDQDLPRPRRLRPEAVARHRQAIALPHWPTSSRIVDRRAAELGVTHVIQGPPTRRTLLLTYPRGTLQATASAVCCVGDDLARRAGDGPGRTRRRAGRRLR